jgi:hypothetical protein
MSSFNDYYNDLAAWEQKLVLPLIAAWDSNGVQNIVNEFRAAFQACSFVTTFLTIPCGRLRSPKLLTR